MNNKKILITGFSGFVARHFIEYIDSLSIYVDILGVDVKEPFADNCDGSKLVNSYLKEESLTNLDFKKLDMTDIDSVRKVVADFKPDYVLHLAAFSSVAYSWKDPAGSFLNNSNIFLNLIEAVREFVPKCRVLSVGSSEEYGKVDEVDIPLVEDRELKPNSPYAVARVSQEMLSKVFVDSLGLDIILTRSFNHIGPRQDTRFVVPSFVERILNIRKEALSKNASTVNTAIIEGTIETGDTTIIRDFVDVRDVVRAYYMLLLNGKSGEIYNICSGKPIVLKDMIDIIANKVGVKVETEVNPEYVRPSDNMIIVGSNEKIRNEIGWEPMIDLDTTLNDMISYMESNRM